MTIWEIPCKLKSLLVSQKARHFLACVPRIELIFVPFRCDFFKRHFVGTLHGIEYLVIDLPLVWLTNLMGMKDSFYK